MPSQPRRAISIRCRVLDFARLDKLGGDQEQGLDAVKQWKDYLVEVTVHGHRTADLSLQMERGAEIGGTVTFDDGARPDRNAFQPSRKTEKKDWTDVGLRIFEAGRFPR